jgi:predicted secreted Zn-dependent protease
VTAAGRLAVIAAAVGVGMAALTVGAAEVHRWVDADGRVYYGDKPPPGATAREVAVPAPAPARNGLAPEVRIEEPVVRSYDIAGANLYELNASAQQAGPISKSSGKRVWGMCTWTINWTYTRIARAASCGVEKFVITVGATIDLPRWINRDSAQEGVRTRWDRFAAALRVHEDGHRDIGVRAANELATRLRGLPVARTCAELDRNVAALGERVLSEYRQQDQAYDRSTDNGATQGAVLK